MASKPEVKKELQLALSEVGTISPWFDKDYHAWIFSSPLYPVECEGQSAKEVIKKYPRYLEVFIEHRMMGKLDAIDEKKTKGKGGAYPGAFLWFVFPLLFLCAGCCQPHLIVRNDYLTIDRYASYHVETPDPRLACPELGQMLTVIWHISDVFPEGSPFSLLISIRFGNLEHTEIAVPINQSQGFYRYRLTDSDYWEKEGILAYKIELISQGRVIDVWRHQLWVELIEFTIFQDQ